MKLGKKKRFNSLYIIILIVFIQCSLILEYIDKKSDDIAYRSVQLLIKKDIYNVIFDSINNVFNNEDLDDVVDIVMNDNNEIISIDYKISNCYKLLNEYIDILYEDIVNVDYSDKYYQDGVYFVSSSLINDVMMFNSLGIKIPMKINVLNDVRVNFKTRVESYGINSILVELYLVMDVKSWFVNPFNDGTFGETYEYVLSSKIINGSVPMYYGGNIEKSSSIVSS